MHLVKRATGNPWTRGHRLDVSLKVALVSRDADARLALVKAFDNAPPSWLLSLHRDAPNDADVLVCGTDVALPGAVVFDIDAPDDILTRVAERAVPTGRAVAITSPSGGTGVTSIAIHVAAELSGRGHSTCVVDFDGRWGIRHRLGLNGDLDKMAAAVPVAGGFRLLDVRAKAASRREALLASALDGFERIVVDTSLDCLSDLGDSARRAVLVVAPTPEGARRARAVLDTHPALSWVVVANRTGRGGETTRSEIARAIGREIDVELPSSAGLRDSEDDHRLLARGWSRWSRGIARLVNVLER